MPSPKPIELIKTENKSHRTKAEIKLREQGEKATLSGKRMQEQQKTKENTVAHKEFLRVKNLFAKLKKDDDIFGATVNRYAQIVSEIEDFEDKIIEINRSLAELKYDKEKQTGIDYYTMMDKLIKTQISMDKQIQTKRKMLLDIEKESAMTVVSALRSIPKKVEKKKSALQDALGK